MGRGTRQAYAILNTGGHRLNSNWEWVPVPAHLPEYVVGSVKVPHPLLEVGSGPTLAVAPHNLSSSSHEPSTAHALGPAHHQPRLPAHLSLPSPAY